MASDSPPTSSSRDHTPEAQISNAQHLQEALDTPQSKKEQRSHAFGFYKRNASALNQQYAHEGSRFFLGPMPVRDFLDIFFPEVSLTGMPSSENAFKEILQSGPEKDIYEPLVRGFVSCHVCRHSCPEIL